jgi:hypothetical protein
MAAVQTKVARAVLQTRRLCSLLDSVLLASRLAAAAAAIRAGILLGNLGHLALAPPSGLGAVRKRP